jgi:hypothetical protein
MNAAAWIAVMVGVAVAIVLIFLGARKPKEQ